MKHLMIDIETMGTQVNAPICSIGAVGFDLATGEIFPKKFYMVINLQSCFDKGLKPDASTIKFWMEQPEEVRAKLFKEAYPLKQVLEEFQTWFKLQGFKYVWGNSASFDLGIMKIAYKVCGLTEPWSHWDELDCRTIVHLNPEIKMNRKKPLGAHDPLVDCEFQISYIVDTIKSITEFKKYVHDRLDKMGVPLDPEPDKTIKTGCRIEGRLNFIEGFWHEQQEKQ